LCFYTFNLKLEFYTPSKKEGREMRFLPKLKL
jgi:hypothetical protein